MDVRKLKVMEMWKIDGHVDYAGSAGNKLSKHVSVFLVAADYEQVKELTEQALCRGYGEATARVTHISLEKSYVVVPPAGHHVEGDLL